MKLYKILFISITLCMLLIQQIPAEELLSVQSAVKKGIENHESIKALKNIEMQKQYELKQKKADRLFNVQGTYSYARLKETPVMKTAGTELESGDKDNFSWDISINQPIFTGFALQSAQDIAEKQLTSANLDTRITELDLSYRIKKTYSQVFLAQKILEVRKQTLETLNAHKQDAEKFYQNGLVPLNDLLKAEVSVSEAEIALDQANVDLKNSKSALNILLGQKTDSSFNIKPLQEPSKFADTFEALENKAFLKRPELTKLTTGIKIARLSQKAAASQYYPKVYLAATYQQNGDNWEASENTHTNSHNQTVGIKAQWTFFDFRKTNSQIKSAEYMERSVEENLKELKKNISLDVKSSLRNLRVAEKNILTAKKSINQAQENFRITNIQYKEQTTTSTEVLNARTYLTTAKTGYFKALYQYWSAMADLERSVGIILD